MPHNPQKQLPRGQGTTDPEFTSQVAVQQAGPAAVVQETPFERLERSLLNIGTGIAGAAGSLAAQQRSLARMKDQAVARHEQMIQSVRQGTATRHASLQQRRLLTVRNAQNELLLQAERHNPEWLFRQARTGFNNSASAEEQAMWSQLLLGSRQLADQFRVSGAQEQENDIVQQYAMAGQTATIAVAEMVSNLQSNPDLQRELMGDGVGIHQRVQNWIISAASEAAPEIFKIDRNDPSRELKEEQRDQLIAELVEKSLGVGDAIVRQHTQRSESTSFQTGTDLIAAQLLSYWEGKIGVQALGKSIEDTGTLHFNHLPEVEQQRKLKIFIADSIAMATSGAFGTDVGEIENRIAALVNEGIGTFVPQEDGSQLLVVDRLFNDLEAVSVLSNASARLSDMVVGNFISGAQEAKLSRTVEIPFLADDGTMQRRSVPDPKAHVTLAAPSPVDGRSEYDRIADRALADSGLDMDASEMSSTQLAAATSIRDMAEKLNEQGRDALNDIIKQQINIQGVLNGDPLANAADAYNNMLIIRAFSNGGQLGPEQLRTVLDRAKELRTAAGVGALEGEREMPEARDVWDGVSPLEYTPETRHLRRSIHEIEAAAWSKQENIADLPANLLGDMQTKWTRGNPEQMMDVMFFAASLSEQRQNELYASLGDGSPQSFALRIAVHNWKKQSNDLELLQPLDDMMDRARQTMSVQSPDDFLKQITSFPKFSGEENRVAASAAFAEVLAVAGLTMKPERGGWFNILPRRNVSSEHKDRMTDIQGAFMGQTKKAMDDMFGLWAIRVQRTEDGPVEAAIWVQGVMRSQGWHIVNYDGEPTMVQDIMQHFGPADPRARAAIGKKRRILTGLGTDIIGEETVPIQTFQERVAAYVRSPLLPWQRSVIGEALKLAPSDIPLTMAEMYIHSPTIVNPELFLDSRGNFVDGMTFVISDATNSDAQNALRKSASDWGGVILNGRTFDGRLLPAIRALQDVEYIGPDGETHILRAGEPISVFTDLLFDSVVTDQAGPPPRQQFEDDAMLDTHHRFFETILPSLPPFDATFNRIFGE